MNILEKLKSLLAGEGRTVKYGVLASETADPLIALAVGESPAAVPSLGDRRGAEYAAVTVAVYAGNYLAGFDLLESIKGEIAGAAKTTVSLVFVRNYASEYDAQKQRYVFKAQFKEIKV